MDEQGSAQSTLVSGKESKRTLQRMFEAEATGRSHNLVRAGWHLLWSSWKF